MKIIFLSLLLTGLLFAQNNELKTVDYVDINKYMGLWYEIAKIPNKFQKHCIKGITAHYSIKKNGEIKVINSCIDEDEETDKAEGVARVVEKKQIPNWK